MTCAKQIVKCALILPDGQSFLGSNRCARPQVECPRAPGEGYAKCRTVCGQEGHAETQALAALRASGANPRGARAYVAGHTYMCRHCQETLVGAGITSFTLIPLA